MEQEKKGRDVEQLKQELLEKYKNYLDQVFAPETFDLTFDEREKLIDSLVDKGRCEVLEEHIEKDPEGIAKNDYHPDETQLCRCGSCAILCKDKEGRVRIFEREIKTKRGIVNVKEHGYYCSKCRKVFFPSPQKTRTVRRKLQP